MVDKALLIKGPLDDLRDVLRIAIVEGRKILKVQDVKVKPSVYVMEHDNYLVVISDGCDGASVVGSGKNMKIGEVKQAS